MKKHVPNALKSCRMLSFFLLCILLNIDTLASGQPYDPLINRLTQRSNTQISHVDHALFQYSKFLQTIINDLLKINDLAKINGHSRNKRLLPFTSMLLSPVNAEMKNKQFQSELNEDEKPSPATRTIQNGPMKSEADINFEDPNGITKGSNYLRITKKDNSQIFNKFMGLKNKHKRKLRGPKKRYLFGPIPFEFYRLRAMKRSGELEGQYPDPNSKAFSDLFPSSFGYYRNPNGYEMRLHDRNELVPYTTQNMLGDLRYIFLIMPNLVRMVQTDGTNKEYGNYPSTHRASDIEVNLILHIIDFYCFADI